MTNILSKKDLKRKILKRLVYSVGKDPEFAVPRDWCVALTLAIRQRVMDNGMATTKRIYATDVKRVYYLSMEFLIGRLIEDVAVNLGFEEIAEQAISALGQDYAAVVANEPDAALGNGGLGRLAACFMDSLSTLGIPAYGYGIRYEHGLFQQHFENGAQVETAETWLAQDHVWEFERPEAAFEIAERDGVPIQFDTRKNVALVAYLAVTGAPHTREALARLNSNNSVSETSALS